MILLLSVIKINMENALTYNMMFPFWKKKGVFSAINVCEKGMISNCRMMICMSSFVILSEGAGILYQNWNVFHNL